MNQVHEYLHGNTKLCNGAHVTLGELQHHYIKYCRHNYLDKINSRYDLFKYRVSQVYEIGKYKGEDCAINVAMQEWNRGHSKHYTLVNYNGVVVREDI